MHDIRRIAAIFSAESNGQRTARQFEKIALEIAGQDMLGERNVFDQVAVDIIKRSLGCLALSERIERLASCRRRAESGISADRGTAD
ncbi:MAG: hypothetical protein ABI810_19485, partial [Sphingomonas bacterium]